MADLDTLVQDKLDAAMPWVAMYITAASAICTLAMAADTFNGFRLKKPWIPCKYFSLNATSLALLTVAMKLPMDLTTIMIKSETDGFAKFMSLIFLSTSLANFVSSLGSMDDKEILANVVAISILVITVIGNVCVQLISLHPFLRVRTATVIMIPSILVLFLLVTLVSLAIMVPTTKRKLELKFEDEHRVALVENRSRVFCGDDHRRFMMKYLVMAETSSPQFVVARSSVSATSAAICFLDAVILAVVYVVTPMSDQGLSPYKKYTKWILYVQSIGVAVGTITPILRWFVAVRFRCSMANWNSFREGFKVEDYWVQILVDCRDGFAGLQVSQNKCWKYFHHAKWFALTFCIGVQIFVVLVSKLLLFLSTLLVYQFLSCEIGNESGDPDDMDLNLSLYVLLLEGETELPRWVVHDICRKADNMIEKGRKKQPRSLLNLLNKFVDFNGLGQFDSKQIASLHSQEPPNCWTLPVVTLTSIAVALPNIATCNAKLLLSSVNEGISFSKFVEKTFDKNGQLVNITKAADVSWIGVVVSMKWLDIDLRKLSLNCKSSKELLEQLSNRAEKTVLEFKKEVKDSVLKNSLNWPARVVAANSMYRISRTILLLYEGENEPSDEGLFEQLSVMIADILAACLTNLPHVITTMCSCNAIEKREKSVVEAFLLLGKTQQIVELLRMQEWPSLDHDKAAYVEEWCALFRKETLVTSEEDIAITPLA